MKRINCLCLILVIFSIAVEGSENGGSNYFPGFYGDFMMAVIPEKGIFLNNFFAAYQSSAGNTGTLLEMPGIVYATGKKFLDGNFIVSVYPGMMATKDHGSGNSRDRFGSADSYIIPAALNWQWGSLTAYLFEGIVAPTGYYEKGSLNTGRNIWTFDHVLSLTLQLPKDNELSMTIGYMNNLKNLATNYHSGDEFHFDYMLGHYLQPELGIGVTGYHYRQTTADHAPSNILAFKYSEASGIGPVVMYKPHIADRDIAMSLKWLHEFNVQGRSAQEYLIWRVFMPF